LEKLIQRPQLAWVSLGVPKDTPPAASTKLEKLEQQTILGKRQKVERGKISTTSITKTTGIETSKTE